MTSKLPQQVFHKGETMVQERLGVRDGIEAFAKRVVRPFMTQQLADFFSVVPFLVIAARDSTLPDSRVWCSLITNAGDVGAGEAIRAANATSPTRLLLAPPRQNDALYGRLVPGTAVGVVGVMLHNRRRNRLSGIVDESSEPGQVALKVVQAYGNCPQYITVRERRSTTSESSSQGGWPELPTAADPQTLRDEGGVPERLVGLIRECDTFFIGTGYTSEPEYTGAYVEGMDASHRGGTKGFVHVTDDGTQISFVDLPGNNHFNTIGNLMLDDRVGLTFPHWPTGSMLQVSGNAKVDFDDEQQSCLVTVRVAAYNWLPYALGLSYTPPTDPPRAMEVIHIAEETPDIKSLYLASRDELPLATFEAGQYASLELDTLAGPVQRTYSLSSDPATAFYNHGQLAHYRITVRRQGLASAALHGKTTGDTVLLLAPPMGTFVLHPDSRAGLHPTLLIGAGVGLTPLISMAHELVASPGSSPIVLLHTVQTITSAVLLKELTHLARSHPHRLHVFIALSRGGELPPTSLPNCQIVRGRLDRHLVPTLLHSVHTADAKPLNPTAHGVHAYICGPPAFMAETATTLETMGCAADQIHQETF